MNTRNLTVALLAAGGLAGFAGCTDGGAGAVPASTPSVSMRVPSSGPGATVGASATATASSAPTGGAGASASAPAPSSRVSVTPGASVAPADLRASTAVVEQWLAIMDSLYAAPSANRDALKVVATGPALSDSNMYVQDFAKAKVRGQGRTTFAWSKVTSSAHTPSVDVVQISACVDASGLKIISDSGKDVTNRPGGSRSLQKYTLNKAAGASWKMTAIESRGEKC